MKFSEALRKLERLPPEVLDETSKRIRGDLGSAEWKMGLCLLAWSRSGAFRELGFATVSEYAERVLHLSGRKIGALLGAARALEHLPLLSEAFRRGEIGWCKVRVIHGVATPENEALWLEFALAHKAEEVAIKATMTPTAWKHHRALKASKRGEPMVSREEVSAILKTVPATVNESERSGQGAETVSTQKLCGDSEESADELGATSEKPTVPERPARIPSLPASPKSIRFVVELTPDQYALYEQAEIRVRAQAGRRLSRAQVVTKMAENLLNQGTARARAKHQVLIHTVEGLEQAWYHTDRGILPVSFEVLEEARQSGAVSRADVSGGLRSTQRAGLCGNGQGDASLKSGEVVLCENSVEGCEFADGGRKQWNGESSVRVEDRSGCKSSGSLESICSRGDALGEEGPVGGELSKDNPCPKGEQKTESSEDCSDSPKVHSCDLLSAQVDSWDDRVGNGVIGSVDDPDSEEEPRGGRSFGCPIGEESQNNESYSCDHSPDEPLGDRSFGQPGASEEFQGSDGSRLDSAKVPRGARSLENSNGGEDSLDTGGRSPERPDEPSENGVKKYSRAYLPNSVVRALYARASFRCERCRCRRGSLHIHHCVPVSEGGESALRDLRLLCPACHSLRHKDDFEAKAHWREAMRAAIEQKVAGGAVEDLVASYS